MLACCADGHIRSCHPVLAPMIADYEEQVMIANCKMNIQCARCQVPSSERQNLTKEWPIRTHEQMQNQIYKQRTSKRKISKAHDEWVHEYDNFGWRHAHVNIYDCIGSDMLHQLYKGLVKDLIKHLTMLVSNSIHSAVATKAKPKNARTFRDSSGSIQLDARFAAIPPHTHLKHFKNFSQVQQWTGSEDKDVLRVLIPVITPLLIHVEPDAIIYSRALADFVTIAEYKSHDEYTLEYLEWALKRIDNTKGVFDAFRPKDKADEAHWNYPKFHFISHYITLIKRFGALNGWTSEHMEAPHKYLLKTFYDRTNKGESYLDQICSWNTRETNLKAMDNMLLHYFGTASKMSLEIPTMVTSMSREPQLLTTTGCQSISARISWLYRLKRDVTTTAMYAQQALRLKGFVNSLAVFVSECREKLNGKTSKDRVEKEDDAALPDSTWVEGYPIQIFGSLKCWKRTGKDEQNSEALEAEYLRCSYKWRGNRRRADYCWVQEWDPPSADLNLSEYKPHHALSGQRVGQIQALIKVTDIDNLMPNGKFAQYCCALVDLCELKSNGIPHEIHGMVEVFPPRVPTTENPRKLFGRKFYALDSILRSAHVVPSWSTGEPKSNDVLYINNYIDWDQYQVLYGADWMDSTSKRAQNIRALHEQAKAQARQRL
jgi:hypothetical protein